MRPAVALERQRPGQPRQNLHQRLDGRLHVLAKVQEDVIFAQKIS